MVAGTPRHDEWMTGAEFTGVIPPAGDRGAVVVRVVRFHGDHVEAFVHTEAAGWRYQRLHARALVGLQWLEYRCDLDPGCPALQYRILKVEQDRSRNTMPAHPDNRDVWLYHVQSRPAGAGAGAAWRDTCAPDRHGVAGGMFVDGQWRRDGAYSPDGYTFSCTRGVIAKCARSWGYKPWQTLRAGDGRMVPLQPLHQACVRAARADYCGDGVSYTRDGTLIDIRDVYGFNVLESIKGFSAEAEFNEHGALRIQHKRWPTGTPDSRDWIHLPTCSRPRWSLDRDSTGVRPNSNLDQDSEKVLISVWSAAEHR